MHRHYNKVWVPLKSTTHTWDISANTTKEISFTSEDNSPACSFHFSCCYLSLEFYTNFENYLRHNCYCWLHYCHALISRNNWCWNRFQRYFVYCCCSWSCYYVLTKSYRSLNWKSSPGLHLVDLNPCCPKNFGDSALMPAAVDAPNRSMFQN